MKDNIGICITIPKTINWDEYKKELDAVADWSQVMNFKVNNFPKNLKPGSRVYLCYNGQIIGWQTFVGFYVGEFNCTTTGKDWKGGFIQRSGPFHYLKQPTPCKGFQGFRYIKYKINEGKYTSKQLISEARSVNDELQKESKLFLSEIEQMISDNYGKNVLSFNKTIFNTIVKCIVTIYNCKNINDALSISNKIKDENTYVETIKTLKLYLVFENGKSLLNNYDSISHELSHIYQANLTNYDTYVTDINQLSQKYRNSNNPYEKKLTGLIYLSDSHEQDSIIQGLESCLQNINGLSVEESYNNSYAKECLELFEKLINDYIKHKNEYIQAIQPYKQFGLDYERFLKRIKNQIKRLKLKIGHILSTHEENNGGRPNLNKIKEII